MLPRTDVRCLCCSHCCVYRPFAPQGDIYHWASLFNHFDTLFDKNIKHRSDIQLSDTATDPEPFPARSVESILKVAATIFENCSNKHNFDSYEVSALWEGSNGVLSLAKQPSLADMHSVHHQCQRAVAACRYSRVSWLLQCNLL